MRTKRKKNKVSESQASLKCIIHFKQFKHQKIVKLMTEVFEKIKHIADLRLSHASGSKPMYTEVCHGIPENIDDSSGYHPQCYAKFTNHIKGLESSNQPSKETNATGKRMLRSSLVPDTCLFCGKKGARYVQRKGIWVKEYPHSIHVIS